MASLWGAAASGGIKHRGDSTDTLCGIRCVQYLLACYGESAELMPLFKEANPDDDTGQYSMKNLQELLARHGRESFGFRYRDAAHLKPFVPCIIQYQPVDGGANDGHFVVLTDVNNSMLTIHDGLLGSRQIRADDRTLAFSPIALVIGDPNDIQGRNSHLSLIDRVLTSVAIVGMFTVLTLLIRRTPFPMGTVSR